MSGLKSPTSLLAFVSISAITSALTAAPLTLLLKPHEYSVLFSADSLPEPIILPKQEPVTVALQNPFLLMPKSTGNPMQDLISRQATALASSPPRDDDYPTVTVKIETVTAVPLPSLDQPQISTNVGEIPLPPKRPNIRIASVGSGAIVRRSTSAATQKSNRFVQAALGYARPAPAPARNFTPQTYPEQLLSEQGKVKPSAPAKEASPSPEIQSQTAIYDISSATLYLPNGEMLEAHSGIKQHRDKSQSVHLRNQGSTPPGEYSLTIREKPFYGVQALRMTPSRSSQTYGRTGFLAHSYLNGPAGDSHGCVAIRNYAKLLKAYRTGQVKKLVVVAKHVPTTTFANKFKRWWSASVSNPK